MAVSPKEPLPYGPEPLPYGPEPLPYGPNRYHVGLNRYHVGLNGAFGGRLRRSEPSPAEPSPAGAFGAVTIDS